MDHGMSEVAAASLLSALAQALPHLDQSDREEAADLIYAAGGRKALLALSRQRDGAGARARGA